MKLQIEPTYAQFTQFDFSYSVNFYTQLLEGQVEESEVAFSATGYGVTWDYVASGAYKRYKLCINDVQYGLRMLLTKVKQPGRDTYDDKYDSIWPLVRISQRVQQDSAGKQVLPSWKGAKSYYTRETIVPENRTMQVTLRL